MTSRVGALDGCRVVDFSHQGAGPWAGTLLGDMGAEVWKVEKPGRGDGIRHTGDGDWRLGSFNFWGFNRNKKSVGIDLQADGGRELALEIADTADVVIENFRPGVMDRLGLGYEALSARNPRIVYGSISAFGPTGPMRDAPGMDLVLQATSGLMGLTGEPDGPPVKTAAPVADVISGTYLAYGIALALLHRERSGRGQRIDVPMLDATISLLAMINTEFLNTGATFARFGSGHPHLLPYGAYEASDGHVVIACLTNAFYNRLMRAIDREDLVEDPRFATNSARIAARAEFLAVFEPLVRAHTCDYWLERCAESDTPACRVNTLEDVFAMPQVLHNGVVVDWEKPGYGPFRTHNVVFAMSDTPGTLRIPPPTLGEHTDDVLRSLGKTAVEIADLRTRGVCG